MSDSIEYYDSETGRMEEEVVYGERFLRWAYETGLGRLTVSAVVKRALFSQWYGWRMDRSKSAERILPFIAQYELNVDEFAEDPEQFGSFNEFFYRRLKPEARPIAEADRAIVYPADGRHLGFENVSEARAFYVKGQAFDLRRFIGDDVLANRFTDGTMMISRLCPVDYHRFHFPFSGLAGAAVQLPGPLRSVSPIALRDRLAILWENRRERTLLETESGAGVLIFEIGATCVGRIHQTYKSDAKVVKGAEKGYFAFGGSCVVTVFEKGAVALDAGLLERAEGAIETYAKMGTSCGRFL